MSKEKSGGIFAADVETNTNNLCLKCKNRFQIKYKSELEGFICTKIHWEKSTYNVCNFYNKDESDKWTVEDKRKICDLFNLSIAELLESYCYMCKYLMVTDIHIYCVKGGILLHDQIGLECKGKELFDENEPENEPENELLLSILYDGVINNIIHHEKYKSVYIKKGLKEYRIDIYDYRFTKVGTS